VQPAAGVSFTNFTRDLFASSRGLGSTATIIKLLGHHNVRESFLILRIHITTIFIGDCGG
jgi:hypothetical protein